MQSRREATEEPSWRWRTSLSQFAVAAYNCTQAEWRHFDWMGQDKVAARGSHTIATRTAK